MKTLIRALLLTLGGGLLAVGILVYLALESSPGVVSASSGQLNQADSVHGLLAQLKSSVRQRYTEQQITLTEDQLNSLTGFAQRAIPEFRGRVKVSPYLSMLSVSYQLPGSFSGQYLNMHISLLPGDELTLGDMQLGGLILPGSWMVKIVVTLVDWWTNSDIASQSLAQIRQIRMSGDSIHLSMAPMDALLRQLSQLRIGLGTHTDDARRMRVSHYLSFLQQLPIDHRSPHSLALYLSPLMREASKLSHHSPAWLENEGALLALAIYAGHHRFANFVGDVHARPDSAPTPRYRPLLASRADLTQHFIYSAAIKILSQQGISTAIGEFKELMDRNPQGSGYSFVDLAADMAGVKLAQAALDKQRATKVQNMLALDNSESLFFPDIQGLPEGISKAAFSKRYGEVDSEAYLAMVQYIEARLVRLPLYRGDSEPARAASQ